jgi:NitT/TauT family transport system substrate-binding protein
VTSTRAISGPTSGPTSRRTRRAAAAVTVALLALGLTACGGNDNSSSNTSGSGNAGGGITVHLGYFPNLTHATALVGIEKGYYATELQKDSDKIQFQQFDSGSDTIEALASGSLDATYIGPSPALTAYQQTHGGVRIIAGAASGGASLVVSSDIKTVADLQGKTIATPGAANTQDIAARYYLKTKGFKTDQEGGGDVHLLPQDNSVTVQAFQQGQIDGAWVPEPYASILVSEGGHVLVDEASLWPQGKFVTTQLLVNKSFLDEHPNEVVDLLTAHVEANDFINNSPDEAKALVNKKLEELTQSTIPTDVFDSAWSKLTFTNDPIASSLIEVDKHAEELDLLDPVDNLTGIYDLDPLNTILADKGESEVSSS